MKEKTLYQHYLERTRLYRPLSEVEFDGKVLEVAEYAEGVYKNREHPIAVTTDDILWRAMLLLVARELRR